MKLFLIYSALICSAVAACQNPSTSGKQNEEENEEKRNVSKRDYSITKANSYSDLFFDSTAMEKFILTKKEPDSLLIKKHKDNKYSEDIHPPYRLLKEQLAKYYKMATAGGWPQIQVTKP